MANTCFFITWESPYFILKSFIYPYTLTVLEDRKSLVNYNHISPRLKVTAPVIANIIHAHIIENGWMPQQSMLSHILWSKDQLKIFFFLKNCFYLTVSPMPRPPKFSNYTSNIPFAIIITIVLTMTRTLLILIILFNKFMIWTSTSGSCSNTDLLCMSQSLRSSARQVDRLPENELSW